MSIEGFLSGFRLTASERERDALIFLAVFFLIFLAGAISGASPSLSTGEAEITFSWGPLAVSVVLTVLLLAKLETLVGRLVFLILLLLALAPFLLYVVDPSLALAWLDSPTLMFVTTVLNVIPAAVADVIVFLAGIMPGGPSFWDWFTYDENVQLLEAYLTAVLDPLFYYFVAWLIGG